MLKKLTAFADRYGMLPQGAKILAAVSGGADSMALLTALRELAPERELTIGVAHFDHRLRGEESDRDREFVRDFCEKAGIPCHIGYGEDLTGDESSAREQRYAFLESLGFDRIATAHTADDNAETMLLNLARGAGARGLAGIPPVRGRIIRPLLCATRGEVEAYLRERGVPHIEDSTNARDDYARNKLRHRAIPVLRELNPAFALHALDAAERLRSDEEYLASLAAGYGSPVDIAQLLRLPRAVSSRVIAALSPRALTSAQIESVFALCSDTRGSKSVNVGGGRFVREYGRLIFEEGAAEVFAEAELVPGESVYIPELEIRICACEIDVFESSQKIYKSFTHFMFKKSDICDRIVVRQRTEGDSITLLGRNVTKTLKKLFIEEKIPSRKRALVPVIADSAGPLAVVGVGAGSRAVPEPGQPAIEITVETAGRCEYAP
ncbi:MAG: tRNA lysidine(34) synthetase TilS [Oscillospiraceae bacterium]|jgi:tRNA(Ile)-lysidine synthase|nr:tRNA lysidine(34) synthetase TilS [Oscillospiraceae bacterium]